MNLSSLMANWWWIALIVLFVILYKFILRVFFGIVIVPENRIGLVTKKFVVVGPNRGLPDGPHYCHQGRSWFPGQDAGTWLILEYVALAVWCRHGPHLRLYLRERLACC